MFHLSAGSSGEIRQRSPGPGSVVSGPLRPRPGPRLPDQAQPDPSRRQRQKEPRLVRRRPESHRGAQRSRDTTK